MKEYNFSAIESKWQKYWDEHKTFEASNDFSKKKFYGLVEFPYPSGHGMHVGHIKAYSGLEVVSRKRRMQGYQNWCSPKKGNRRQYQEVHGAAQKSRFFIRLVKSY